MKILLINGSPRDNGNTFTALSEVAKTLNGEASRRRLSASASRPYRVASPVACVAFADIEVETQ